jgi:RNA recognition motif-containing protein
MARVYVGNLPFSTTEDEMVQFFSEAGPVSRATVIRDKLTNRSRGFGFVEFDDDATAQKAIQDFNGRPLGDRPLKVAEAKPQEQRDAGGGGSSRR